MSISFKEDCCMGFVQTIKHKAEKLYASPHFNTAAFMIIAVMVLIAYSNTFNATFHFDDTPSISDNAAIKHVTVENIAQLLRGNRPVVYLSLMLNYQLNGLNVVGYHIFNIGIHIVNSIFVYLLVLWTLGMPVLKAAYHAKAKRMALFCALLFACYLLLSCHLPAVHQRGDYKEVRIHAGDVLYGSSRHGIQRMGRHAAGAPPGL
jgi:hypothetical protein